MAFLTSRIDNNFFDQKKSESARSRVSNYFDRANLSSRSYASVISGRRVNSPVYPEDDLHNISSEDNVKSMMSETQSDIVPPLDIVSVDSEDNYPTKMRYTFSYRKHCEADKNALKPEKAFETWLSAKRKLISDGAAKRKKEEELKQKEIEERKRLAKEKYDMWLLKKSQTSLSPRFTRSSVEKPETCNEIRNRPKIPEEVVKARLKEWKAIKAFEIQHRRMIAQQEEEKRRQLEEERRRMADEAWERWIANVDKKPKPVPLNRGIFTLRGTVSDIFVNPNEWKPLNNED